MFEEVLDRFVKIELMDGAPPRWELVVGGVLLGSRSTRWEQDEKAVAIRRALQKLLEGAYHSFSADLRTRLRWPTGEGSDQTVQAILDLVKKVGDLETEMLQVETTIDALMSERDSLQHLVLRGGHRMRRFNGIGETVQEILNDMGEEPQVAMLWPKTATALRQVGAWVHTVEEGMEVLLKSPGNENEVIDQSWISNLARVLEDKV